MTIARATREYIWLVAPEPATRPVRVALLLTGKPCRRPAVRLDVPRARSSSSASGLFSCGPANALPVRTVSEYPTRAIPRAGMTRLVRCAALTDGTDGTGSPLGTVP